MKRFVSIVLVAALVAAFAVPVVADTPFQGYTYNHWGALVPSPAAYAPTRMFDALMVDPTIGHFSDPTDIHVAPDGTILVTDRGNNRIVAFDAQLNLVFVLYGFYQDGVWQTFNRPHSAFVTRDFNIFIADTENFRIPILDWEGNLVREITAPTAEGLEDDFVFRPLQILVDRGGRTYVIVQNVFEGIMNFDHSGEFVGYFGTIEVGFNPLEFFWRLFMTETQIARQNRWIPTEFQSMALDQYNFVFTTNLEPWGSANQVMRLNPRGEDVLNNINDNVTIAGDQNFRSMGPLAGPSQLIDIIARPHGMFTALCQVRNRLYTYDNEGNLLYVFGGTGNILGMTSRPVAIEMLGEDILVLCAWTNRITQFSPTEYGALINLAIGLRYDGDERGAVDTWRELTRLDEHFALAWAGIGRSLLAEGENRLAMEYLRRGMDMVHYSIAFRRFRLEVMRDILPVVLNVGLGLIFLLIVYKIVMKIRRVRAGYRMVEEA